MKKLLKNKSAKKRSMKKKYGRKVISLFTTLVLINLRICFFNNVNNIEIENVNININIVNTININ